MAEITKTNSVDSTESGALANGYDGNPQQVSNGFDNIGNTQIAGGADTDLARQISDGLVKDGFDDQVVKMGFSTTPINAMTRDMGSRPTKSMVYGYYSVDIRKIKDALAETTSNTLYNSAKGGLVISAKYCESEVPARLTLLVENETLYDVTDVICFKGVHPQKTVTVSGVSTTVDVELVDVCARICSVNAEDKKITIQFLNCTEGVVIPIDNTLYILGHAASETDAKTTPYSALPQKKTQFMQKFMVQSLISSVMLESEKEVNWTKTDLNEILMQQFTEDIEKFYIKGVKSYTFDPTTKLYTRTTSGILEQMAEGGAKVYDLYKDDLEFTDLLDVVSGVHSENTGSPKRYLVSGRNVGIAVWGIKDIYKTVQIKEFKDAFGYDFNGFNLLGYEWVYVPDPLLDRLDMSDYALVLDRSMVERRVFRSLEETVLEMKNTGTYDGESTVYSEISSIILKYPKCHALIRFNEGSKPTTGE